MSETVISEAVLYDVFAPLGEAGGKKVAVFPEASGDLQARAAASGAPLSVFLQGADVTRLDLRVFTPTKEKGESDSASIAALEAAHAQGVDCDLAVVVTGRSGTAAQRCGSGDWLLDQGVVEVQRLRADLGGLNLAQTGAVHTASTARPNLVVEVPSLAALTGFQPDADAISAVNRATATTGLVLYTLDVPAEGPQRRADVSFRCFGPLKGFLEDAASSNMLACLTGVLNTRGLLADKENIIRAAQCQPGRPALLTVHFGAPHENVWVGGTARLAQPS